MRMRCAAWALLFSVAVVPAQATWIEPFISEIHYATSAPIVTSSLLSAYPVGLIWRVGNSFYTTVSMECPIIPRHSAGPVQAPD